MSTNTRFSGGKTGEHRWSRFTILVSFLFLSGCATSRTKVTFEQREAVTGNGSASRQTVLSGFFLGAAMADLAVVEIDEASGQRRLRFYSLNDGSTGTPQLEATLGAGVVFVDVAKIDGRDRLVTYHQAGRLHWFDPLSGRERYLFEVTSNFTPPRPGEVPQVDVTRDLNQDGLDDLVVPGKDGFQVSVQRSGGAFAAPVTVGHPFEMERIYASQGYRYDPWEHSRIHEVDYDGDGRSDLAIWNEDHFEVHLQDRRGLFARTPQTYTTEVAFDSDDLSTLAAPQGVRHRRKDHQPAGAMTGKVLHALTDLNGDGIADLGIFSLEGGSPWKMHASYEVHFGASSPGSGTEFATDADTSIHLDGILYAMEPHDFNGDRQIDMAFTTFSPGVFNTVPLLVGSYLTNTVPEDLEFFRMNSGRYPAKPNTTRKIRARPGGSGEEKQYPAMLIGDVNGDRLSDLLLHDGDNELRIFLGLPGPEPFARLPQKIAVAMPHGDYTWLTDLNKDGRQDVLVHDASPTRPHRVTALIAR